MFNKKLNLCKKQKACVPIDPFAVLGNVFGIEKFAGWRVLAKFVFAHGTAIHEGLSNNRQARVDNVWLVNVKDKIWILDHVHPEPQRQTEHIKHIQQVSAACVAHAISPSRHWADWPISTAAAHGASTIVPLGQPGLYLMSTHWRQTNERINEHTNRQTLSLHKATLCGSSGLVTHSVLTAISCFGDRNSVSLFDDPQKILKQRTWPP